MKHDVYWNFGVKRYDYRLRQIGLTTGDLARHDRFGVMTRYVAKQVIIFFIVLLQSACSSTFLQKQESWLILKRTSSGTPEIVSVIKDIPDADIRRKFPFLLEIAWGYESLPNGMPTEKEILYARKLHGAIDRIVGSQGMHAMSRTGDGGRTFYYYIESIDKLREPIREFFDNEPPLSVKVTVTQDVEWKTISNMHSAIK